MHHVGDVRQSHRRSITVRDNHGPVTIARQKLIVGADGVSLPRAVKVAFCLVNVRLSYGRAHIFETEPVGGERRRICLNADGRLLPAADTDQPHAGQLRNLLGESCVSQVLDLRQRKGFRSQCEGEDRSIRGVRLAVDRRVGQISRQERGGSVDRRLHFLLGNVNIEIQRKLQSDERASKRAGGGHLIKAGDLSELAFEWRRHRRGHHIRAGPGIEREHLDRRVIHLRQCRDRQLAVGHGPCQEDGGHEQRRRDRAQDERPRGVHESDLRLRALLSIVCNRTLLPARNLSNPSTTTSSPGDSPFSIDTLLSSMVPTAT